MKRTVHLGFEVGTGHHVSIPIEHLAICGITQNAGKTTALEALIQRSGLRAVTFVTKRGEGSFTKARRIRPYFREQADWQYVASILEASRGEKLKFERAWIIRASKGARTLADVQANVRAALVKRATGKDADVYLCLDAYLDVVVPQIAAVKWAPALELETGVNAVDLGDLPLEMQHLVIRSTINWVLEREKGTVIVIPEAWKFIPEGRGTPVKMAAEAFIRQGAALGNYLWLDSQDLGGISKAILRSVSVWLLGVQREANEIKRTLDNIPGIPSKPKPAEIATLGLGEFFACWADKRVKTYVQPVWMSEAEAVAVSKGIQWAQPSEITKGGRRGEHSRRPDDRVPPSPTFSPQPKEEPEMCEKHAQLEQELVAIREDNIAIAKDLSAQRDRATRAEARAREAEETAGAAADLGRALARLIPAGTGGRSAAVVDVEKIVNIVLQRIPAGWGGAGAVTVTPPEKLRKEFQREEADRIVAAARAFKPLTKRVLKLMEALEGGFLFQKAIADRLGRSMGGGARVDLGLAVKELTDLGWVAVDGKRGVGSNLRAQIAADLDAYVPSAAEVEQVYQSVLYVLATEGEAAA